MQYKSNSNGNWTRGLRGRLLWMVALPVALLAGVSIVALNGIKSQRQDLDLIARKRLLITEYNGEIRAHINALGRLIWLAYVHDEDFAARKSPLEEAKKRIQAMSEVMDKYEKLPFVAAKGREILSRAKESWMQLHGPSEQVITLLEKNTREADAEAKKVMFASFVLRVKEITQAAREATDLSNEINESVVKASEENSNRVNWIVTVSSVLGSFVLLIIGFFISSRLARTLSEITHQIGESSMQVGSASEQLSAASQKLSSGATEGAASLEETVSSLEELSSMVKLNADNAKEAAALSQSSSRSADEGEAEIQKLIGAMSDVAKSSKKIEEIINVIDDIAFQTNLLALNAAVEAARAGEQGKGFAVVADAVRNLAQRSSSAAKDITTLIKESVTQTENGGKIADQSGAVLKNIVTSVKKVAELNHEISNASQQQSDGLGQISKAMNQLDIVTQNNASSAEEAAAASEEMSAQANTLGEMVTHLTTLVEGSAGTSSNPVGASAQVVSLSDHRKTRFQEMPKKVGTTDGF